MANNVQLNKKIRVLHLVGRVGSGGVESLLVRIHSKMNSDVVQSTFFLWDRNDTKFYGDDILEKYHIDTVYGDVSCKNRYIRFIKKIISLYKFFQSHKDQFDIFHIHCSDPSSYFYGFIAKKAGIKKVILHSHTSFSINHKTIRFILIFPIRCLMERYIDSFIACSHRAGKYIFPPKKTVTLFNAIDVDCFRFDEEQRKVIRSLWGVDKSFVVGHVGRFSKEKNHVMVVKTFKKVLESKPNSRLILVGEGKEKQKIRKIINKLSLDDYVLMFASANNIAEIMMGMDVMIFPSLCEGMPLVAIEAQAASLPIYVSCAVPKDLDITEYIKYMGKNKNAMSWAKTILADENRFVRRDNTIRVKEMGFDISDTANKLIEIYNDLLSR